MSWTSVFRDKLFINQDYIKSDSVFVKKILEFKNELQCILQRLTVIYTDIFKQI